MPTIDELNKRIRKRLFALILTAAGASLVGVCIINPDLSFIGAIIGMVLIFAGGNMNGNAEME